MDHNHEEKKPAKHGITYQVGWTRGTINPRGGANAAEGSVSTEAGVIQTNGAVRKGAFSYRGMRTESFAERVVWRRLPSAEVPGRWVAALLWAAPILSFAMTYALVAALISSGSLSR